MATLWSSDAHGAWRNALDAYPGVIARQGVARLAELDDWYRTTLPASIAARKPQHVTLPELVKVAEWKMSRGVWRGRNLALVKGNETQLVVTTSTKALAAIPDLQAPIKILAELEGVGPATASAVVAAARPDVYPFFDEIVGEQIPGLGTAAFTFAYYARYANALRERAKELGKGWTPADVAHALWSNAGGKAGKKGKR
jgi:hypothetical protein